MSYVRTIPRDLFNEANLLKCYGQLWLKLEGLRCAAELDEDELRADGFRIVQSPSDGALTIANLPFRVAGEQLRLWRPLNSREPWPLWCDNPEGGDGDEEVEVFTAEGELTPAFLRLIGAEAA